MGKMDFFLVVFLLKNYSKYFDDFTSWVSVEGMTMGVSRNNIIFSPVRIGKQPDFMDFTCGSISTAGIKRINSLKMYRLTRKEGSGTRSNIVSVYPNEEPTIEAQDLRAAGTTVQGSVVNDQYSIQAFATLTIPTIKLICDDVGQYTCELNYEDSNGVVVIPPMQDSINFTGYAVPDRVSLIGQPEIRRNGDGSENCPFQMKVDDVIEFTCSGRIGGDTNAQWEWKKTGDTTGDLTKLVPTSMMYQNRVNETQGPAIPIEAECTNTRTTTLRYTITSNDQNTKAGNIQFQCYTESQGANVSSRFLYIQVEDYVGPTSTDGGGVQVLCTCQECDADQKAAIVGGCMGIVIACLSVALVYVLIRHHNCFKTKGNPTYEIPQRSGNATLTYDSLQQPGDSYEVPVQRTPHIYSNTDI